MEGSRRAIHAGTEGHRNALATMLRIAQIDVPMNSFNNSGRSAGVRAQAEPHSHVAAPLKVATIRTPPSPSRTPLTKNLTILNEILLLVKVVNIITTAKILVMFMEFHLGNQ